jgi:hypothetical protein
MAVQPFKASIVAGTESGAQTLLLFYDSREAWLNAAVELFSDLFEEAGAPLPRNVRVSIGFCSTGRKSRRIGECWDSSASEDGHFEIFLKPELPDAIMALDVLAHELVHAAVGLKAGHGGPFKRIATAIGLTGKMTSTVAGPELRAKLEAMHGVLGAFPYARLAGDNGRKKQSTRLVKCECGNCFNEKGKPYSVRMSREWIEALGAPICPGCNEPTVEQSKGESEGE